MVAISNTSAPAFGTIIGNSLASPYKTSGIIFRVHRKTMTAHEILDEIQPVIKVHVNTPVAEYKGHITYSNHRSNTQAKLAMYQIWIPTIHLGNE